MRGIISRSVENMVAIYKDIGRVARIVEESMTKSAGFNYYGGSAISWETSGAWYGSESWLRRWFARAYYKGDKPKKMVGFCIHLGGYPEDQVEDLNKSNLELPIINISLLSSDSDLSTINTNDLYNLLYGAGWWPGIRQKVEGTRLAYGEETTGKQTVKEITFFLDLLTLTDGDTVGKLVVEPMIKMYSGQEDWILKKDTSFPALSLASS